MAVLRSITGPLVSFTIAGGMPAVSPPHAIRSYVFVAPFNPSNNQPTPYPGHPVPIQPLPGTGGGGGGGPVGYPIDSG